MTIIETEQSKEIPLTEFTRGPFTLRFISYRKSEDAKLNLRSEDYIVSELNPAKAAFALCDGVGSSFYGNLGSQILGEILLEWMGKISPPNSVILGKEENAKQWLVTLSKDLNLELNKKTKLATDIIQKKDISGADELTRLAEKTQRDDFGTQSNFACGMIWRQSAAHPNGLIVLLWLGNARLRIYNKDRDLTQLLDWGKNPNQLREVWSSKEGVVGSIYSYMTDLSKVSTVIAYSDGLENVEDKICPQLNGAQLENLVSQAQSIKDDDVTFLELLLREGNIPRPSDDIVNALRKPGSSLTTQPTSELQQPKQNTGISQRKKEEPVTRAKGNQGLFIIITPMLALLCFLAGFFIHPVLSKLIYPSPTPTITPSSTPTPSTTPSPSQTATATETLTATLTSTATDTPTFTSTPSESSTPNLTVIASETGTSTPAFTATPKP